MKLFGLDFAGVDLERAAELIVEAAARGQKGVVVTPNVDHVVLLEGDPELRSIYERAMFVFADGMPLVWLSKLLPQGPLPARVTGADLLPKVCELASKKGLSVMLVGGNEGVADKAAANLQAKYPGLRVAGTYFPPFGFEANPIESERIVTFTHERRPHILFIGVGAPKQEKWAAKHLEQLETGPILCVGAAFDFEAGTVDRAPAFFRNNGLEWMWRLMSEPGRLWKRYLMRDSRFFYLAFREWQAARRH